MIDNCIINTYEETRKKQLEENRKRFEDLGILSICKSLSNSGKKSQFKQARPKLKSTDVVERRCSSRATKPVTLYRCDDDTAWRKKSSRKKSKIGPSSWASYLARPLVEVKMASNRERARAITAAEKLQSNLQSQNPSFIKSMLRSHVYSCFWLIHLDSLLYDFKALPTRFCEDHLPKDFLDMVLEDENGAEYNAKYLGKRTGLSGGWKAFALEHKLDDGDALVFELIEPARFKIYTVKAGAKKPKAAPEKLKLEIGTDTEIKSKNVKETGENGFVSQELLKKGRKRAAPEEKGLNQRRRTSKPEEIESDEKKEDHCVVPNSRERAVPARPSRKRV